MPKTATTTLRPASDGALACAHRDLSVCPTCFASTPGLVDVYSVVYAWEPEAWEPAERADILAGRTANVAVSPGTAAL